MAPKNLGKPKAVGKFSIKTWNTEGVGERIIVYGDGGVGKSTLASLAPNPVFIALSDGAKEIVGPEGKRVRYVDGIETIKDLRDALAEKSLWTGCDTIVLDDLSTLEIMAEQHVVDTYPAPANRRSAVTSIRHFGYDGSGYLVEVIRLILGDIDNHIYQNRNFVGLAHSHLVKIASAEGMDYVEGGPRLQHNSQYSVRDTVYNWADHVVMIDFANIVISKDEEDRAAKAIASDDRVIFTQKSINYQRKSRQLKSTSKPLPPQIAFSNPADDTFWECVNGNITVD